jgi:hypothetical protein
VVEHLPSKSSDPTTTKKRKGEKERRKGREGKKKGRERERLHLKKLTKGGLA